MLPRFFYRVVDIIIIYTDFARTAGTALLVPTAVHETNPGEERRPALVLLGRLDFLIVLLDAIVHSVKLLHKVVVHLVKDKANLFLGVLHKI